MEYWRKARGMKPGGTFRVTIPSDLAYGDNGAFAIVPGGATLTFEVELLSIEKPQAGSVLPRGRLPIDTPAVSEAQKPLVGVVMGSDSDWPTMEKAVEVLAQFGVPYEARVVSAHRTPELLVEYSKTAQERGLKVIIAGAGGAAHLPGMVAAMTILPVLGVPVQSRALSGMDSLLSIVQMPKGIPVATFAIGEAGAGNAGLSAVSILATSDENLAGKLQEFRDNQRDTVLGKVLPPQA